MDRRTTPVTVASISGPGSLVWKSAIVAKAIRSPAATPRSRASTSFTAISSVRAGSGARPASTIGTFTTVPRRASVPTKATPKPASFADTPMTAYGATCSTSGRAPMRASRARHVLRTHLSLDDELLDVDEALAEGRHGGEAIERGIGSAGAGGGGERNRTDGGDEEGESREPAALTPHGRSNPRRSLETVSLRGPDGRHRGNQRHTGGARRHRAIDHLLGPHPHLPPFPSQARPPRRASRR